MQPIIHDFAGFRVMLTRENRQFRINVSDENLNDVDSFVEIEDDLAALQFEQVVYNLHIAKDDVDYRLPLMDNILEDQFKILGEQSYQNYVKEQYHDRR